MPDPPASPPPELGRLLARRPVLWLGAGASRQAEPPLPTLDELAARLQESFGWTDAPADRGAYAVFDAFLERAIGTEGDLHDFLEAEFRPGGVDAWPGPLHDHLAVLAGSGAFPAILDPNYDLLLRRALQHRHVTHTASVLEQNLARPGDGLWYLSLHGTYDDWKEIVLTGESYRDFDARHRFLQAALDLLLLRHPVLFVGASLTDPRLLAWLDGLPAGKRRELKTWLAVVSPGTPQRLEETPWRDGRSVRQALGDHVRLVELPDFAALPAWFAALAEPARRERDATARDLTLALTAEPDRWTFRAAGAECAHPPPDLGDDLAALRRLAGAGIAVDAAGEPLPESRGAAAALRDLAVRVGKALTALLPDAAREALTGLAATAAARGPALCRLRVDGAAADAALLLPWELVTPDGERFPVALGELHLVREALRPGLADADLPETPPPLAVVAHLAAPEGEDVPELHLEDAAFRMAVAIDRIGDRTRFTELGTLDDLAAAAAAVRPTLLHFSGHGEPGHLLFEDETGGPHRVPVSQLLGRLSAAMETLPRAVWLSCCFAAGGQGGATATSASPPPPAAAAVGIAREWGVAAPQSASLCADLHRAGIPQVLGYFGPVPDALAVEVDRRLFEGLAETGRTLEAVRRARLAVQDAIDTPDGPRRYPLAWALLALYHRGPDRLLADPGKPLPRRLSDRLEPQTLDLQGVEHLAHGFIGRRRLLAELRALRHEGERVLGLYGLGGLGKTASMTRLASILAGGGEGWQSRVLVIPAGEYSQALSAGAGDPFRWLWARIDQALAGHALRPDDWEARAAAADQSNDPPRYLARLLLEVVAGAVLYVDNAETLQQPAAETAGTDAVPWASDDLAAFFATLTAEAGGDATILLTTRYRPAATGGAWREITPASPGEVFRMTGWYGTLRRLPPALRRELAAERLAGHPRAVQWTDALLHEAEARRTTDGGPRLSPGEDAETVRTQLLDPALAGLPEKVEADLALATLLDRLAAEPLALLGEAAAVGHPVPLAVVDRLGPGRPTLVDRGLLARYRVREDRWAVHPFVRQALAGRGGPGWTAAGRAVLGRYWQDRASTFAETEEALHHLLAAELWGEARDQVLSLSNNYHYLGWYRARLALLESLAQVSWPERERADWLYNLGTAFDDLGWYDQAEVVLQQTVDLSESVYGTREHHMVATSLHGLANVLHHKGRYAEAERLYRESIDIEVGVQKTSDHPSIAAFLAGLANSLTHQGRYREAEGVFREAVNILVHVHGTHKHPDVSASLHGLANVLFHQGRYNEAELAYRESIDVLVSIHGTREHPAVSAFFHGLAGALDSQGRYDEAENSYRESIKIKLRAHGTPEHPEIAASFAGLANVLLNLDRYAEAERAEREAIEILVRVHRTRKHDSVAAALHGLANILFRQDRYLESERTYREAIDILFHVHQTYEHPKLLPTLINLALVLQELDRSDEALVCLRDAWGIAVRLDIPIYTIQIAIPFIQALLHSGRALEAGEVITQTRPLLAGFPADHPVRRRVEAFFDRLLS